MGASVPKDWNKAKSKVKPQLLEDFYKGSIFVERGGHSRLLTLNNDNTWILSADRKSPHNPAQAVELSSVVSVYVTTKHQCQVAVHVRKKREKMGELLTNKHPFTWVLAIKTKQWTFFMSCVSELQALQWALGIKTFLEDNGTTLENIAENDQHSLWRRIIQAKKNVSKKKPEEEEEKKI